MSDGFRSAEIGAPAFVRSSACGSGCTPQSGHVVGCAVRAYAATTMQAVPLFVGTAFTLPAGGFTLTAPAPAPATCPHCGGDLGTTSAT